MDSSKIDRHHFQSVEPGPVSECLLKNKKKKTCLFNVTLKPHTWVHAVRMDMVALLFFVFYYGKCKSFSKLLSQLFGL